MLFGAFGANAFEEKVDIVADKTIADFERRHVKGNVEYAMTSATHEVGMRLAAWVFISCRVRRNVDIVDQAFLDKEFQTVEHCCSRLRRIVFNQLAIQIIGRGMGITWSKIF